MEKIEHHLKDISEIRSIMERSAKFISLSGLSGISAGVIALLGVAAGSWYSFKNQYSFNSYPGTGTEDYIPKEALVFYLALAGIVLILALLSATFFSIRMANRKGLPVWNKTARHLAISMLIPLAAGGFFSLILLYHGIIYLIAPSMLIFYGMALLNASKFTLNEIRYLGICEIILGLMSAVWVGYGIVAWAIGFGILHIAYGIVMYYKYER